MGPAVVQYRFERLPSAFRYFPRAVFGRRSALVPDGEVVPRLEGRRRGGPREPPASRTLSRNLRIPGRRLPADHVPARARDAAAFRDPDPSAFRRAPDGPGPRRERHPAVRPLPDAGRFELRSWIEGHRDVDRGHEFDVFTAVEDGQGTAWIEKSTLLARRPSSGKPASRGARQALRYEKPPEGSRPETAAIAVPRAMGRRYGWLSGDLNPIHLGDRGAKLFGFERAVAHGMWSMARSLAALGTAALAPPVQALVEFKFPLFMPGEDAPRALGERRQARLRAEGLRERAPAPRRAPRARLSAWPATLIHELLRTQPGEERAVGLAFAYFFMLMCGYYLLRPLRDAMASGVVENLFWFYVGTFTVMLLLTPFFGALVSRVRKPLAAADHIRVLRLEPARVLPALQGDARFARLAASFFVWVSVYNMFVVSVFWSFMVGRVPRRGGEAPVRTDRGRRRHRSDPRAARDAVPGAAHRRRCRRIPRDAAPARYAALHPRPRALGRGDGTDDSCCRPRTPKRASAAGSCPACCIVARSPYLLGIFAIIALGSIAAAFMYNELLRIVGYVPTRTLRAARSSSAGSTSSSTSWPGSSRAFVVGWLIRRFELAGALVTMPIVALLSFLALAASPVLLVLAAGQVLRRGGEYGIAKPSREVLFTVVDAETKYKAKNFIDTVLQRGSDLVGIGLVTLAHAAGFGLVGYAWIGAALMLPALAVSLALGRNFERRRSGTGSSRHFVSPAAVQARGILLETRMNDRTRPSSAADAARSPGTPGRARGIACRAGRGQADRARRFHAPASGSPRSGSAPGRCSTLRRAAPTTMPRSPPCGVSSMRAGACIDSSPMYGSSEERVGDILAAIKPATPPFLATKIWTTGREAGERQLADSHRFMRAKILDLVQVHNLQDLDTHLATLRAARDAGTVRYIGVTHYLASAHAELERVIRREKPDFLQVNYSIAEPEAGARLLPVARELGVAVLVNRPFTKGAMIDRAAGHALPPVAAELGCRSAAQLFIKWVLGDPAVTVVLAATRNPRHAAENLAAAAGRVPDDGQRKAIAGWFGVALARAPVHGNLPEGDADGVISPRWEPAFTSVSPGPVGGRGSMVPAMTEAESFPDT